MIGSYIPRQIQVVGQETLRILWEDGHESSYPFRDLRLQCPCAVCVDEWTGASRLDPAAVAPDLQAEKWQLVGNYAIAFQFSDGHSTGVYSFEKLRRLCGCAGCRSSV